MVSHYEIMNYWKNKCITSENIVTDWNENLVNEISVVVDEEFPQCWACGKFIFPGEYIDNLLLDDNYIKKIWNNKHTKSNLQICHIRPKAMGGSDAPDNLFLMCRDCHTDSPDTIFVDQFYAFIRKRRKEGSIFCRAFMDAVDLCKSKNIVPDYDRFQQYEKNNSIYEYMNYHGFNYSQASYAAVFYKILSGELSI